jgi:hypothetical protein
MATWRWADLSTAVKPPAPVAWGEPFAYGVPVCDEGGPTDFDSDGCSIAIARVVYRAADNQLIELSLNGGWQILNLTATAKFWRGGGGKAPFAGSDPSAYVSNNCNGVARVTYGDESENICQLALGDSGWTYGQPYNNDGATPAAVSVLGRPIGYWDYDNAVDRLVYQGGETTDIYELSDAKNETWVCANLSTSDKSDRAQPAAGFPFGYNYGGVPRVIYRGLDGHIWEGHPTPAGWIWADLSSHSGGAPQAVSDPYAYVFDVARVIYADTNGQIIELALEPKGWQWSYLSTTHTPPAAGNPFGYSAFDGIPRVIYRGTDGHIYELYSERSNNYFWKLGDLSKIANATSPAQVAAGDPFGYVVGDSIPRVVYRATNNHINELALY